MTVTIISSWIGYGKSHIIWNKSREKVSFGSGVSDWGISCLNSVKYLNLTIRIHESLTDSEATLLSVFSFPLTTAASLLRECVSEDLSVQNPYVRSLRLFLGKLGVKLWRKRQG